MLASSLAPRGCAATLILTVVYLLGETWLEGDGAEKSDRCNFVVVCTYTAHSKIIRKIWSARGWKDVNAQLSGIGRGGKLWTVPHWHQGVR